MKKLRNRLLVLPVVLLLVLSACGRQPSSPPAPSAPAPSQSEPPPAPEPTPEPAPSRPDFDALMLSSAAERIDDPAFLSELWDEYLFYTYMNLSNGYVGFDSVEALDIVNLCEYLHVQMQRAGDTEGIVNYDRRYDTDARGVNLFAIPTAKLERYCERYFDRTVDFADPRYSRDPEVFFCDTATGLCHFYPGTAYGHFAENPISYDRIDEWPGFALNFVDRYDGDVYMADVATTTVMSLNDELLTKKFILIRREDGSFYFDSCHLVWPQTDYISASGRCTELPYPAALMKYNSIVGSGEGDGTLIGWTGEQTLALWDVRQGAELRTVTLPEGAGVTDSRAFRRGERVAVMTDTHWGQWDLALGVVQPFEPLPGALLTATGPDVRLTELYVDLSTDLTMMAFADNEGVKVYSFDTGEVTLLPGTAMVEHENIMKTEGYRSAEFAGNSRWLWCGKVGYESLNGYLLYDLATGEQRFYDYRGGYGSCVLLTDRGACLIHHMKDDTPLDPFFLDFETGETTPMPGLDGRQMIWSNVAYGRYSAWTEFVERVAERVAKEEVVVQDNATGEIRRTGCFITSPECTQILGVTDSGSVFVSAQYLGERYLWQTEPIT